MSAPEFVLERNHFVLGSDDKLTRTFRAVDHVQSLDVFPPSTHFFGASLFISNQSETAIRYALYESEDGNTWTVLPFSDYATAGLLLLDLVPLGQGLIVFMTTREYLRVTAIPLVTGETIEGLSYCDLVQYIPRGVCTAVEY